MGDTNETLERRTRRAKLTVAERLAPVEQSIKTLERKLAAARQKRVRIIEQEETKLRDAQSALAQARALEQVEMDTKD